MKYRRNPHTGLLDDSGAIIGSYPALKNPTDTQSLAEKLDVNYRPYRYNSSLASTFYISSTGSDSTGDGTSGSPVSTIDRALQFIGQNNPATVTLSFGAGTFTMPTVVSNLMNITFSGTVSTDATDTALPVASITTQSNNDQLVFTITRGTALANDAWRGKMISFATAGTLTRGWVYRNVGNTLYVTVDVALTTPQLTTSSTISLLSLDTTLRYLTGSNTLSNSSVVQVTGCNITGDGQGRIMYFVATDKFQFNDCYFGINRPQMGQAGGSFIFRCYINSLGDTTEGVLSVVRGGNLRIGSGSVIDTQNAGTNEKFIRVAQASSLSFDGPVVCRGLEAKGWSIDGSNVFVESGVSLNDVVLFENGSGTTSCAGAFTVNQISEGSGGTVTLPKMAGAITGNFCVVAGRGALVRVAASSSIVSALGTNIVSAGGAVASSRNIDQTVILDGIPTFAAGFLAEAAITFANSPYTLSMKVTELVKVDTTAGVVVVNLPAANTNTAGAKISVKRLNNASVNQVSVTPNGADTIDLVAGVYAIAVAGGSVDLVCDGVNNWTII